MATDSFPQLGEFRKPCLATGDLRLGDRLRLRVFQPDGGHMLAYVPVNFALYRPLKPHLRWTLQCLVAFADRDGKCWPTVRTLAEVSGVSKSSVSRHLAELTRSGVVTRTRRRGGGYEYRIDSRFLPLATALSHPRAKPVPPVRAKENSSKKSSDSALPDDGVPWANRVHSWRRSNGRFWNQFWGPRPDEPGCWVPPAILAMVLPPG